jgi:hypothetical protein
VRKSLPVERGVSSSPDFQSIEEEGSDNGQIHWSQSPQPHPQATDQERPAPTKQAAKEGRQEGLTPESERIMKRKVAAVEQMRANYDFDYSKAVRGKYYKPAVNDALRVVLRKARAASRSK